MWRGTKQNRINRAVPLQVQDCIDITMRIWTSCKVSILGHAYRHETLPCQAALRCLTTSVMLGFRDVGPGSASQSGSGRGKSSISIDAKVARPFMCGYEPEAGSNHDGPRQRLA